MDEVRRRRVPRGRMGVGLVGVGSGEVGGTCEAEEGSQASPSERQGGSDVAVPVQAWNV